MLKADLELKLSADSIAGRIQYSRNFNMKNEDRYLCLSIKAE